MNPSTPILSAVQSGQREHCAVAHLELTPSGRSHVVLGGTWGGHRVGTARKAGQCQYNRGAANGGRCDHVIQPGEKFVYGEIDHFKAGGWAQERYCLTCAKVTP